MSGDFNLPGIVWMDGNGQLGQNPAYGFELNSLFLDIIHDSSLEQFNLLQIQPGMRIS